MRYTQLSQYSANDPCDSPRNCGQRVLLLCPNLCCRLGETDKESRAVIKYLISFKAYRFEWPTFPEATACVWCGHPFLKSFWWERTKEHIVPRKHTPSRGKSRISASHRLCNNERDIDTSWVPHQFPYDMPKSQAQWCGVIEKIYPRED